MKVLTSVLSVAIALTATVAPAIAGYVPNFKGKYYTTQLYVPTGERCVNYTNTVKRNGKFTFGKINVRKGQTILITDHDQYVAQVVNPKGIHSSITGHWTHDGHMMNTFTAQHSGDYTILSMDLHSGIVYSSYEVCIY